MGKAQTVSKRLEDEVRGIWTSEPAEVRALREGGVEGTYGQKSSAILYSESETREMVDYLWYLMKLLGSGEIGLDAAKAVVCRVLELKQDKWRRWYKLAEAPGLITEAVEALREAGSEEEFLSVLEPLQIYVGKYNFWLDNCIPWKRLCEEMDGILGRSKSAGEGRSR